MITYRNYIFQILGRLLPQFFALISQIYFFAGADVSDFSSFWLVIIVWGGVYSFLGSSVDTYFQKIHVGYEIKSAIFYKVSVWFILCIFVIPVLTLMDYEISTLILISISFLSQHIISLVLVYWRVVGKDILTLFPKLLQSIVLVSLVIFYKPNDLKFFSLLYALSWVLPVLVAFYLVGKKNYMFSLKDSMGYFSIPKVKVLTVLGLSIFATQVYANVDFIFLEMLSSNGESAEYKFIILIASSILPIVTAFAAIYYSKLSLIKTVSKVRLISIQVLIISVLYLCFAIFVTYMLQYILQFFPNIGFQISYAMLLMLIIGYYFNSLASIFSFYLVKEGRNKEILIISLFLILFSILIAFLLISTYGLYGAYLSMMLINLFVFLMFFSFSLKSLCNRSKCL